MKKRLKELNNKELKDLLTQLIKESLQLMD
jgi:hypothetical protein